MDRSTGPLLFAATAVVSVVLTLLPKREVPALEREVIVKEVEAPGGRRDMVMSQLQQLSPLNGASTADLMVVTRVHGTDAHRMATVEVIETFVAAVAPYATKILICIGNVGKGSDDERKILDCAEYMAELNDHLSRKFKAPTFKKICLMPVHPWGEFTAALNAALGEAVRNNLAYVCYQSLEFRLPKHSVHYVKNTMDADPDLLVAGPAMAGHEFAEGFQTLRGRTCPWNTFAIWRTKYLSIFGFPMVGDGFGTKFGGVEEVSAIALAQYMYPNLKAALLQVPGVEWHTHFDDQKRLEYHKAKMESKDSRPLMQLEALDLVDTGYVQHIVIKGY